MMMMTTMMTQSMTLGCFREGRGRSLLRATVLAMLASSGAAGHATAQAAGDPTSYEWSGSVPAGGTLEIKGVNGSVHASRAAGGQASVTATLRGRGDDPGSVRVERVEHA